MAQVFVPLAITLAGALIQSLFPQKGTGRLDSLNVAPVNPGQPVIQTFGTMKIDGQMIFTSLLIETEHSGKGGGGKAAPYYTYSVDCAISACKGPVYAIKRIRANQKLLWINPLFVAQEQQDFDAAYLDEAEYLIANGVEYNDALVSAFFFAYNNYSIENTTPNTADDSYNYVMAHPVAGGTPDSDSVHTLINRMFAGIDLSKNYQAYTQRYDSIEVYTGTELQRSNAMIESYVGAGKSPAYRGLCYVAISGLQLADFSNAMPSFQFEIVKENGTTYLSDVITSLCEQAGLTTDQIQCDAGVSAQAIGGYAVTDRQSARDSINTLMQVYPFYGAESGWALKFGWMKKRPVAIVRREDFGAHMLDEEPPPSEEVSLANPLELPQQVTLKYQDPARNYSINRVDVLRSTVAGVGVEEISVPIALDQADALSFTQDIMSRRWLARRQYKLVLPRKYGILEAGDAILVPDKWNTGQYYALFIQQFDAGANGVIHLQLCDFFTADYIEPQVDTYLSTTSEEGQTPPAASATYAYMLDIPLLTDSEDDNIGYYAALGGTTTTWEGGALLLDFGGNGEVSAFGVTTSVDSSGSTWYNLMTGTVGIAHGFALTALPDANPCVWDLASQITVQLYDPDFVMSSYSQADCIAKPVNVFVIGDEIVQAANINSLGHGVFVLSTLLRGGRGTDYATGTHTKGERFVQLDQSAYKRITHAQNQLQVANSYRSATIGDPTGDSQVDFTFTDTGNSLRPLSVMIHTAHRDDAGNVYLEWLPRARQNGGLIDGSETLLDQAVESYSIDVGDGTVVKNTYTTSDRNWTYTAADATTDFGAAPATAVFDIYEIGAVIGRGFVKEVTV